MQVRLWLGPAGSGKTFRCLDEARQVLSAAPEGAPLILVAPKQGTYQLEQQLLGTASLAGYTRLAILSFDSLARYILNVAAKPAPQTLTEEGRLMVLRGLLAEKRHELKLFRASARLTGFAQQLSQVLNELQRAGLSPEALRHLAAQVPDAGGLSSKLQDLACLLQEYLGWLERHKLQDEHALLQIAAKLIRGDARPDFQVEQVWVDGFAEFSEPEQDLLCALAPCCERLTITLCVDPGLSSASSWLSPWSVVRSTFEKLQQRFAALPTVEVATEGFHRDARESRFFENPVLQHLEQRWARPESYPTASGVGERLRVVGCVDREAEVTQAAREILVFVRSGARYRDVSVLVRKFDPYYQLIQRVFRHYEIPFFLDRRESVSHHPLAELTRSAIRTVAFGWQHEDWFAALKSGLVPAEDEEIDLLENEALARGWKARAWHQPIQLGDQAKSAPEQERLGQLEAQLERIRRAIIPAFERFALALATANNRPAGPQLAAAVRGLWMDLEVQQRLERWSGAEPTLSESRTSLVVHETVWGQLNAWLDNAALAFPREPLPLREWLPILEAGLANLTVGIIPPALDQVLIGAVDRSRTPEVQLAIVLGLNETVFPSTPEPAWLLSENDRVELEKRNVELGSGARRQLSREKYLAYIACTRARQRLVLTYASRDQLGAPLNSSALLSLVRLLFPSLQFDLAPPVLDWKESEHISELKGTLWQMRGAGGAVWLQDFKSEPHLPGTSEPAHSARNDGLGPRYLESILTLPGVGPLFESLRQIEKLPAAEALAPELAARLYGPVLRTSVSRMEQFACCPFKFFVHSGLRAEERKLFELDVKEQGTFQHDLLSLFHQELSADGKRWRDIPPTEARERVGKIARALQSRFREGLLDSSEETRFTARVLTESLQDFVETLVGWMQHQYQFDPVEVELPFGEDHGSPPWTIDLGERFKLELRGRIDRVDVYRRPDEPGALCVVVDYKSSHKQLDAVLLEHGLQLQLLAYLNVLQHWPNPAAVFGADSLQAAGAFYVNLRGSYDREPNRLAALADPDDARRRAYRHAGRFDIRALPHLDSRPGAREGDQFNYRLTNDGQVNKNCREAVAPADFATMLRQVETNLKRMGAEVYSGRAAVDPYRRGAVTACDQCEYQSICRIDPWTHRYRILRSSRPAEPQP